MFEMPTTNNNNITTVAVSYTQPIITVDDEDDYFLTSKSLFSQNHEFSFRSEFSEFLEEEQVDSTPREILSNPNTTSIIRTTSKDSSSLHDSPNSKTSNTNNSSNNSNSDDEMVTPPRTFAKHENFDSSCYTLHNCSTTFSNRHENSQSLNVSFVSTFSSLINESSFCLSSSSSSSMSIETRTTPLSLMTPHRPHRPLLPNEPQSTTTIISLSNIQPSSSCGGGHGGDDGGNDDHSLLTFEEDETFSFVESPCKQISCTTSHEDSLVQRNYVPDTNCLSPPMLLKKSQLIKDSEFFSKYGNVERRATLTPVSFAFLTQHQTQRNSLSKKGNFIHRLSIRKLDDTIDSNHSNTPLMFLKNLVTLQKSNRTSPSSPSSSYCHSNTPISNNILHQMITNHGVSVHELSQIHDVVLIFLRSFTCPFTKYSISDMTKEYQHLLNMNTLPVFVHQGSGFLEHDMFSERVETRKCEKKGLTRLWRSFYKSTSRNDNSSQRLVSSRDSLHTIFGANCVQSDQESFTLYKSLIEDYHRVSDPTGYLFFNHFNIRKLPMKSLINLSSLFSAITMTLQGYSVGICTNHLSQVHRLPVMFRVSKGEICEQFTFVDLQDKPDYIDYLVDANSEESVNLDYEFLTLSPLKPNNGFKKSDPSIPEVIHSQNMNCVTIHPDKYIYSNNISSVPTDQLRDMNDNFEKNSSEHGNKLRKTFSCFFGNQHGSPKSSPKRNNTGSSMDELLSRRSNLQILTSTDALKSARNELFSSLSDIMNDPRSRMEFKNYCEISHHLNTFCLYDKLKYYYQTLLDVKTNQQVNIQTLKCIALTILKTFLNEESKAFVFSIQPHTIEKVKQTYEKEGLVKSLFDPLLHEMETHILPPLVRNFKYQ